MVDHHHQTIHWVKIFWNVLELHPTSKSKLVVLLYANPCMVLLYLKYLPTFDHWFFMVNVGKYTIHGWYGICNCSKYFDFATFATFIFLVPIWQRFGRVGEQSVSSCHIEHEDQSYSGAVGIDDYVASLPAKNPEPTSRGWSTYGPIRSNWDQTSFGSAGTRSPEPSNALSRNSWLLGTTTRPWLKTCNTV